MAADQILNSYVETFATQHELEGLAADELFEHFVNWTVVSKLSGQQVDPLEIHTGKAYGVDGMAIFVNDQFVVGADQVDDLSRNRLDAHFAFIQAKTSTNFDLGDTLKFLDSVKGFFTSDPTPGESDQVSRCRKTKAQIFKRSIKMEIAPTCDLYYVCCGRWIGDPLLATALENGKEALKSTGLFSEVKFTPVDVDKLKSYYRALKQQVVKQITFEKYAVIPKMTEVDQAYIGVLPASEYLKLIMDTDGNLERNLFYDNVRDFHGDNAVNTEISQTIRAALARQDKFAILNNGVTIVAREIRPIGTEFTIRDYQIVNGCQTSHVLYFNRAFVGDSLYVPIKLVATASQDVANLVTKATNRQTEIKDEAFATLEPFHKKLEEFYASFNDPAARLFYERRSHQYDRDNIAPARIISIAAQTKAYVAMFSGEPHNAHHYYGELLRTYWQGKKEMYQEDHDPWPYYAAAQSYVQADRLLKSSIAAKYRPYRFHLLDLIGKRFFGNAPSSVFKLPQKRTAERCQGLLDFWMSGSKAVKEVTKILELIEGCFERMAKRGESRWDGTQRRDFTEEAQKAFRHEFGTETVKVGTDVATTMASRPRFKGVRVNGKVKRVGVEFGFIVDDKGQDVFFHRDRIVESNASRLNVGASVEFTPILGPRGLKAVDIVIRD